MKANEFVKIYGWEKSKMVIEMSADDFSNAFRVDMGFIIVRRSELKRLVESWELVERIGNIHEAKNLLNQLVVNKIEFMTIGFSVNGRPVEFRKTQSDLKQAIADVESCND